MGRYQQYKLTIMADCIYISATLFLTCIFIHNHWLTGTLTQTLTANVRKISMSWAGLDSTHLLRCETGLKTHKLILWCAQYICKNLLLDIVVIKRNNYCWKEQCYNYLLHFLVQEDDEYECASVLHSHSQDVKRVVWHPDKEVRAKLCST